MYIYMYMYIYISNNIKYKCEQFDILNMNKS